MLAPRRAMGNNSPVPQLENTFSWSISRHGTFSACPRRYWYHYYGSWGGWAQDAPEEAREIYALKNLSGLHLLAGDTVHRAIERALHELARTGDDPDPEESVAWCKGEMQRAFRESCDERLWRGQPKQYTRLFEHHYGPQPDRAALESIATRIGTSVRNFFFSSSFELIREIPPDDWLAVEGLDTFEFEGTKVYAVPDFACRHDGRLLIFDWKTGRPDARNRDQVVLYALYAADKWGADPDRTLGAPVYLLDGGEFDPQPATPADRERVAELMRRSIREMRGRLADPAANAARREDFETTPGSACRFCNFRGLCPDAR